MGSTLPFAAQTSPSSVMSGLPTTVDRSLRISQLRALCLQRMPSQKAIFKPWVSMVHKFGKVNGGQANSNCVGLLSKALRIHRSKDAERHSKTLDCDSKRRVQQNSCNHSRGCHKSDLTCSLSKPATSTGTRKLRGRGIEFGNFQFGREL